MISLNENRINQIITKAKNKKVLVFGDLMIDQYLFGKVSRISPEAPVPVIEINQESLKFGGAANVALNIHALGCKPILSGVIGQDKMGDDFLNLMEEFSLNKSGLLRSKFRPTTLKTRIIGESQHIARLDKENSVYLSRDEENNMIDLLENLIDDCDAIILEDYNKGVLTKNIIKRITSLAKSKNIKIFVDPKFINFMDYENVTLFKPNLKETEEALAIKIDNMNDLEQAGNLLLGKLKNENVLITRGSQGMSLFTSDGLVKHIPTRARKVSDVSGAGDTVISTLTMAFLGGASNLEAVTMANFAAGIVCEEVGIVPVDLEKLKRACIGEVF